MLTWQETPTSSFSLRRTQTSSLNKLVETRSGNNPKNPPYGWRVDPENNKILISVPREIQGLRKAKKFLKQGYSWNSVAKWLSQWTGRPIYTRSLIRIVNGERHKDFE